jgi:hypothetical protein
VRRRAEYVAKLNRIRDIWATPMGGQFSTGRFQLLGDGYPDERLTDDFYPRWHAARTDLCQTTHPDNSGALRNRGIDHSEAHRGGSMTEPDATPQMCLECGTENAGAAQGCARCEAPLAPQPPAAAATAGEARGSIPLPDELACGRNRPEARRHALIGAGLGLVLLAAMTVLVASVTMIITRSVSARPSASSARPASSKPSASPPPSRRQLSVDQLEAGNCLTGSDLILQP